MAATGNQPRTPRTLQDGRQVGFREVPIELRDAQEGKPVTIAGYILKFNVITDIGNIRSWGYREVIRKGSTLRTIAEDDIRGLFNHDTNLIIGRKTAGTLRLSEDEVGLRFEIDLPNNTVGNDLAESIRRKDIRGCSFMFVSRKETWGFDEQDEEIAVRELLDIQIFECGPVTFPAYEETEVDLRSRREAGVGLRDKVDVDDTLRVRLRLAEAEGIVV